jgi:uncharacterized integral membrane protein
MRFFLFIALLIAIMIIIFTTQNSQEITLDFVRWEFTGPLPLILALPFIAGVIGGMAMMIPLWWKKSRMYRAQKKRIQELEERLAQVSSAEKERQETETAETTGDELQETLDTDISVEQKEV